MKKSLAIFLSVCMVVMSVPFSAFADGTDEGTSNEVILSVSNATWTLPESAKMYGSNDYGSDVTVQYVGGSASDVEAALTDLAADKTYVTYTVPDSGVYKVEYYYPCFSGEAARTGRNAQILDSDIEVKHANGTDTVTSTKPSITGSGWVEIGTYEFNANDTLKVTANQDNKYFKGNWNRRFLSSQFKLTPVTDDYSALLTAVNSATTSADLKTAVTQNSNGFVDISALKYMGGVYDAVLAARPTTGFTSAYAFKTAFDNAVKNQLTTTTVNSSSFVWQSSAANVESSGYRINCEKIEIGNLEGACAIVTFNVTDAQNVKSVNLKLSPNSTDGSNFGRPTKITQYSADVITLPNNNKEQNKDMMKNATFTPLATSIPISVAKKEISDNAIISAVKQNGYISFYIVSDDVDYNGATANTHLSTTATLDVVYDKTTDPNMNIAEAAVNSTAANTAKVFDLTGFDTVSAVSVNDTALASDKYTVSDNRLKIDGSVFDNAGEYKVSVSNGSESRNVTATVVGNTILENRTLTGTATVKSFTASEWNIAGTTIAAYEYGTSNTSDNTYVTYSGIPSGAYEVYYQAPNFKGTSIPNKRNLSVLDTSVSIKDKNGTTVTESTKKSVSGGNVADLGTYEFDGSNDEIKVYVNSEHNKIEGGQYTPNVFVPGGLILKPAAEPELIEYYFQNGTTYLQAVNSASTGSALQTVLKSNSFVDTDALFDMSSVYEKLAEKSDYTSVYAFKQAFDKAVDEKITKKTYDAQILSANTTNEIRSLNANQLMNPGYYLVTTFKDVDKANVLGAEIKLNTVTIKADANIKSYSYDKYDRTYNDALNASNGHFDAANTFVTTKFTDLTTPILATMADKAVIDKSLFNGITDDKYISFRFETCGDILTESANNGNTYTAVATMTVYYDSTVMGKVDAAKAVAGAATLDDAKASAQKYKTVLGLADGVNTDAVAVALWGETVTDEDSITALTDKIGKSDVIVSNIDRTNGLVTVKNLSTDAKSLLLMAATYGENVMNEVVVNNTDSNINGVSVLKWTPQFTGENAYTDMKVFVFDGMTNLAPYDNAN